MDLIDRYETIRDRHDRHVLASAAAAGCDIIITGDKDLLVLGSSEGIRIINAKEAMRHL